MEQVGGIELIVRNGAPACKCLSFLWICEVCEKPASCLCTDCVTKNARRIFIERRRQRAHFRQNGEKLFVTDQALSKEDIVAEMPRPAQEFPAALMRMPS